MRQTVFKEEHLRYLANWPDVQRQFARGLAQQPGKPFAVIVELPYRHTVWEHGGPAFQWRRDDPQLATFGAHSSRPVGLVTQGVMEVYESVASTGRKKTATVLEPGTFFGLFESYAIPPFLGEEAPWIITSGIVSFLVGNYIGNATQWRTQTGRRVDTRNWRFTTTSTLSFEGLLADDACTRWQSRSVWLKPDLIDDLSLQREVTDLLTQETCRQLSSLARQLRAAQSLCDLGISRQGASNGPRRAPNVEAWMQYLDAVIAGNMPIFHLVEPDDNSHLPVSEVVQTLQEYDPALTCWDILIPKQLKEGERGIHPENYVPRFPEGAWECISDPDSHKITTLCAAYGRQMAQVPGAQFCAVQYRNEAIVSVNCWEHCVTQPHSAQRLRQTGPADPPHPLMQLDGVQRTDSWPDHLKRLVIIDKSGR